MADKPQRKNAFEEADEIVREMYANIGDSTPPRKSLLDGLRTKPPADQPGHMQRDANGVIRLRRPMSR